MEGWIKLYRKFSDWEWFNISEMVHLFIYLLLNANHEDGEWRGVKIQRGQILTGLKTLNERTKISFQTLRTCLKRLEKTKEINIQVTNKYSIITICNYESYQNGQQTTNKQANKELTSNQQTTNKQLTTNNNNKELKELKNEKNLEARETIFVSEVWQFAEQYSDELLKKFIRYWTEKNKSKTKMRFELEATFEVSKRLAYWAGRNNEFSKSKTNDPDEYQREVKRLMDSYGNQK